MRKTPRAYFLMLSALIAIMIGCGEKQAVQQIEAPLPVVVAKVARGEITDYVRATGVIEPYRKATIGSKLLARVVALPLGEGAAVKEGDVVVTLDAADIRARLKQAEAAVGEAQAALKNASLDLERTKSLVQQSSATQKRLEDAQLQYDLAQARVAAAQAAVEVAKVNLTYAVVAAPFDGVVTRKHVEVGDMAAPGAPLVTVEELDKVKVVANVLEREIGDIAEGDQAIITVDAAPGREFPAGIETILPSGDPLSHSFEVKVVLENANRALKPGMFSRARIVKDKHVDTLLVPMDAVVEDSKNYFVYKVTNDRADYTAVQLGLWGIDTVEISGGVQEGDQVVVSGQQNLSQDKLVRIVTGDNI